MNAIKIVVVTVFLVAISAQASAQTIRDRTSCESISGNWTLQVLQPARFATCELNVAHTVNAGTTLRVELGIDINVKSAGRLINNGTINLLNTTSLLVNEGIFINNGLLTLTNRASVVYNRGMFNNTGDITSEGDLFVNNTFVDPVSKIRECINNSGKLSFFSGGNILSAGCIDGANSGRLDLLDSASYHNQGGALYRGGMGDLIVGRFENEYGAYAEFRFGRVAAGGRVSNAGRVIFARERFHIDEGGSVVNGLSGAIDLTAANLDVDGALTLNGGWLIDRGLSHSVQVGSSGEITLNAQARAWTTNNGINLNNNGRIVSGCFAHWRATPNPRGNPIFLKPCKSVPIPPPRKPFL